jgi:hypothetical protein
MIVQLEKRATATGYLIYAAEARRLARLIDRPPPLAELPRRICCGA